MLQLDHVYLPLHRRTGLGALAFSLVIGSSALGQAIDDGSAAVLPDKPLRVNPAWSFTGKRSFSALGESLAIAGDVNGDGFDDVLLGAPWWNNAIWAQGRAYVFLGSPSGPSSTADWSFISSLGAGLLGTSVSGAGDVNGDGLDDIIVGAPRLTTAVSGEGAVFAFYGTPSGPSPTKSWRVTTNQSYPYLGQSVSSAGDVNGDGYDDVVIGAHFYKTVINRDGAAFVYHGSPTGLGPTPDWATTSDQFESEYGWSVAGAGDVNGDGYDDVLVGARFYQAGASEDGRVFLYHGSPSGLSTTPDWVADSPSPWAEFGASVAGAGDLNGDGYDDVAIGAPKYSGAQSGEGRAYVYMGSPTGLASTHAWTAAPTHQLYAYYGISVTRLGDVDGDGFDDLGVGCGRVRSRPSSQSGRAYVYRGSAAGLRSVESWAAEPDRSPTEFGKAVGGAGDVNGDGLMDLLVGAPTFTNTQQQEGSAFLFLGFPLSAATGAAFHGGGSNPICFSSEPPVLGQSWDSTVTTTVQSGASLVIVDVRASSSQGFFLAGGELLVDPGSPRFALLQSPVSRGTTTELSIPLPLDTNLAGITATAQGGVFGSGYTLCNAYRFVVGF